MTTEMAIGQMQRCFAGCGQLNSDNHDFIEFVIDALKNRDALRAELADKNKIIEQHRRDDEACIQRSPLCDYEHEMSLLAQMEDLERKLATVTAERDAAVADIVLVADKGICQACKHIGKAWDVGVCSECDDALFHNDFKGKFEWRGAKDSAEAKGEQTNERGKP